MKVTIVGVKKSESKGRKVFTYAGLKEYTPYEQNNAECEGQDVISEFSFIDFNLHAGDVVDFEYEPGFQQRATLTGVRMLSMNENSFESGKDAKKETKQEAGK